MSNPVLDARGRACPEPVLIAQKAAKEFSDFTVLVDNRAAVENIRRFCGHRGLSFQAEEAGGEYRLTISAKA